MPLTSQFAPCTCHLILLGRQTSECKRDYGKRLSGGENWSSCPKVASCPRHPQPPQPYEANEDMSAGFVQKVPPIIPSTFNDFTTPVQAPPVKPDIRRLSRSPAGSKNRNGSKSRNSKSPSNSILDTGEDKKTLQRKLSKNTAFWKCSTLTMPTMESIASPRFMWDKYLKHFTPNQLDLLWTQFDGNDAHGLGKVTVDQALGIMADWNELNHELDQVEPDEGALQEILMELGKGVPVSHLNFEQFVSFVRLCEINVVQADDNAGFSTEELEELLDIFETHSKDRVRKNADGTMTDETRKSLSTTEVFEVLEDAGRDTSELAQQLPIVDIIKEMDVDYSGDLDWGEFLQFMRKVRMLDAVKERELEHHRVCKSSFNDTELDDFQQLFHKYTEQSEGIFYVDWFVDVVESTNKTQLDKPVKAQLKQQVRQFGDLPDGAQTITFGEFLIIMRQMIDQDVCGIKSAEQAMVIQMEEDRRYLSPEEYEQKYSKHLEVSTTSSWVRRMLDNKAFRRASRLSLKGNTDMLIGG